MTANTKMNGPSLAWARNDRDQIDRVRHDLHRAGVMARQDGLSLVELMVALVVSSFIMIGLVQVFMSTRVTYRADEGLARLQENGRFAMDFLERDLRMAGFMGCMGKIPLGKEGSKVWMYLNPPAAPIDLTVGIFGFDATNTRPGQSYAMPAMYPAPVPVSDTVPTLDTTLIPGAVQGSDVLVLRSMDAGATLLVRGPGGVFQDETQVFVGDRTIRRGQVVVLTNCNQTAVFEATDVSLGSPPISISHAMGGTLGNRCAAWGVAGCPGRRDVFQVGSQISVLRTSVYYIGQGANLVPSLFRQDIGTPMPPAVELVEGIENMQILYGVDNNDKDDTSSPGTGPAGDGGHNADSYYTADQIPLNNWTRVVSVRIGLLVSSSNVTGQADIEPDTSTYTVAGVTLSPQPDRRRRRVFTTTVVLRNL